MGPSGPTRVAMHRVRTFEFLCSEADEAIQSSLRAQQVTIGTEGLAGHSVFQMIVAEACVAFLVLIIWAQVFSTATGAVEDVSWRGRRHGGGVLRCL